MIVDHNLSPMQNIVNLINVTNGTQFAAVDFVMSELTQFDFTNDVTVKNSTVLAVCTLNNKYYGNQLLTYRRLYLTEIVTARDYTLQTGDTLASILTNVAARFSLIASEIEWDTTSLNVPAGQTKPFTLRAKATSLCYLGELVINISKT